MFLVGRSVVVLVTMASVAFGGQMTGYISDEPCGWNNARPGQEAKECAVKCVRAGWAPVFVLDGQRESFKIQDKTKVLPFVGDHVVIVGDLKGDTVSVRSIRRSLRPAARPANRRS